MLLGGTHAEVFLQIYKNSWNSYLVVPLRRGNPSRYIKFVELLFAGTPGPVLPRDILEPLEFLFRGTPGE